MIDNEAFFAQLERDRGKTQAAYDRILERLAHILLVRRDGTSDAREELQALLDYIAQGEGAVTLQYIPKVQDIIRILSILLLEATRQSAEDGWKPLDDGCENLDVLFDKYRLVKFALWRLFFRLSEESVAEAKTFLQAEGVSVFAQLLITQGVLKLSQEEALRFLQV